MPEIPNRKREAFARCVANGMPTARAYIASGYTAKNSNVAKACGSRLLAEPTVAARIAELKPAAKARALVAVRDVCDADLRRRADRVSELCANYRKLKALIAARAADENHPDIAGAETGYWRSATSKWAAKR